MIESLTLQGFKSFADRTRLEFSSGVCAVIGPNGSGKSNVVEAIRWVTHQARARELRAAKATELIFHGSGSKAPVGLAEVQLELKTPGGLLSLSRRLYRDGTSDQELAGRGARVRDIHAALRGTGLGPGGLAVIGQGEVSGVVQAEGRTLLGYLQEAAGLSRAVAAREDTESRLQVAQRALDELRLIENELLARVHRLAEDSAALARHRNLRLRELALQEALHHAKQEAHAAEWRAALRRASELEEESARLVIQTAEVAAQLEQSRERLRVAETQRAQYLQAAELLRAAQSAQEQLGGYLSHLEREYLQLQRDLAAPAPVAPDQAAPDAEDLEQLQAQLRAQLAQLERAAQHARAELERARQAHTAQVAAQASRSAQHAALSGELAALDETYQADCAALTLARQLLSDLSAAAKQAEQQRRALAAAHADAHARAEQLRRDLSAAAAERAPLERERHRLEQQLNSYARYGEGPRKALQSAHPGILGSVADLMTVSAEYEVAATAALGRRLEQVVVERADDARQIIELLKREGGRATFLPLELLRPAARRESPLRREAGVVGYLAELCPTDPPQVAEALLGATLLVSDLRAATRLARAHAARPRLVTLEGELLESGGALTGGRLRDAGFSVLADQRRLHELEDEVSHLSQRQQQLEAALAEQLIALAAFSAPAPHDPAPERQAEGRLGALEAAVHSAKQRRSALTARLDTLKPPQDVTSDLSALEQRRDEQERALSAARHQERAAGEQLAQARQLRHAHALFATTQQQRAALVARLDSLEPALAQQRAQMEQASAEVQRRAQLTAALQPAELAPSLEREALSVQYSNLLAHQNKVRADLESALLSAARQEGSLEERFPSALLIGSPRAWNAELGALRNELSSLGPVNARAEADHAEEAERLLSLQAERDDAQAATHELRGHLEALAGEEALATEGAYARVGAAFANYSGELLGGSGELEAERDARGHLSGLKLAVQPKGKRTRSLNLLSAGERTMAGLGFLFALNHAAPEAGSGLPLAVLDEVDAPLDEANIRRFTHFLTLFASQGAQFVLITHQKATMEVARTIWGVTTGVSGASMLLSIRQDEQS